MYSSSCLTATTMRCWFLSSSELYLAVGSFSFVSSWLVINLAMRKSFSRMLMIIPITTVRRSGLMSRMPPDPFGPRIAVIAAGDQIMLGTASSSKVARECIQLIMRRARSCVPRGWFFSMIRINCCHCTGMSLKAMGPLHRAASLNFSYSVPMICLRRLLQSSSRTSPSRQLGGGQPLSSGSGSSRSPFS